MNKKIFTKAQSTLLRRQLQSSVQSLNKTAWGLADLLYRVDVERVSHGKELSPWWYIWGYGSFDDYAVLELGLEPEKALLYASVAKKLRALRKHWRASDVKGISLDRLVIIADVVEAATVREWLSAARTSTVADLKQRVRAQAKKLPRTTDGVKVSGPITRVRHLRKLLDKLALLRRCTERIDNVTYALELTIKSLEA